MKRILALLLVLCFIGLALVACGNPEGEPEDTENEETEEIGDEEEDTEEDGEEETEESAEDSEEDEEETEKKETSKESEDKEESKPDKDTTKPTSKPTTKPKPTESQEVTSTETDEFGQNELISAVPTDDLDFEGTEIHIVVRDNVNLYREWYKKDTDAADLDATLDDAIVTRNAVVEASLNIAPSMDYQPYAGYDDCVAKFDQLIRTDVLQGAHLYDIVVNQAYPAINPNIRDCLANVNDKDLFPYFNFYSPCWNQAIVENTLINDKLYVIAGDINLSLFDYATVIWCNKDLYAQQRVEEEGDPENIQDWALEGYWIYENLYVWAQRTADTDPATVCGDMYGFAGTFPLFDAAPAAWDFSLIAETNDGRHEFTVEENTKAQDALDALNILTQQVGYADYHSQGGDIICTCDKGQMKHFTEGSYVFMSSIVYGGAASNELLRNMEMRYCILPVPKWDADQENYGTTSADTYNLITVPNHYENIDYPLLGDEVSAYLQLATEESYTDVRKYYFERIIKSKFFGAEEDADGTVEKSQEIFDMIVDSIEFRTETIYSTLINDIGWLWRDNILRGNGMALATAFQSNNFSGGGARDKAGYIAALEKFDAWLYDEL